MGKSIKHPTETRIAVERLFDANLGVSYFATNLGVSYFATNLGISALPALNYGFAGFLTPRSYPRAGGYEWE
jgi:hypothetical protein